MTFKEWLDEPQGFASRQEWLINEIEIASKLGNYSGIMRWLQAAYDVGYEQGKHDSI